MPISLYAEYLQHIRTISVHASLPSPSTDHTQASLSDGASTLTISHQGESASVRLPIPVAGKQNVILPFQSRPSTHVTLRVPLDGGAAAGRPPSPPSTDASIVPWSAGSLTGQTTILCGQCRQSILPRGTVADWKDLPSQGWADMMDFWHCHKPSEPHDPSESRKGYAANGTLAVRSGVGLVGITDFLLLADDCQNCEVVNPDSTVGARTNIQCITCKSAIGDLEPTTLAYRLRKAALAVAVGARSPPHSFDKQRWLACHLLSTAEGQGVRKFNVQAVGDASQYGLKVWIFTPHLLVTSSALDPQASLTMTKILWRRYDESHASSESKLNKQMLFEADIDVSAIEMDEMHNTLVGASDLLPLNAKTFQDWNVSLLCKFVPDDLHE